MYAITIAVVWCGVAQMSWNVSQYCHRTHTREGSIFCLPLALSFSLLPISRSLLPLSPPSLSLYLSLSLCVCVCVFRTLMQTTHAYTHMLAHTHTYTHTRMHTHAYTHKQIPCPGLGPEVRRSYCEASASADDPTPNTACRIATARLYPLRIMHAFTHHPPYQSWYESFKFRSVVYCIPDFGIRFVSFLFLDRFVRSLFRIVSFSFLDRFVSVSFLTEGVRVCERFVVCMRVSLCMYMCLYIRMCICMNGCTHV